MDTYAADVAELVEALDLQNSIHIGHSTGGGEVTRYVAQHGKGRVAKAVLISSIPPHFQKSDENPDGVPKDVVDASATVQRTIVHSSTSTSRCLYMASTVRGQTSPKASNATGGGRA